MCSLQDRVCGLCTAGLQRDSEGSRWYEAPSVVFSSPSREVGGKAQEEGREEQLSPIISEQTAIYEKKKPYRCFYATV